MKGKTFWLVLIGIMIIFLAVFLVIGVRFNKTNKVLSINLTNMTYLEKQKEMNIKKYTQEDFNIFLNDYQNDSLPEIYVTQFLFDGVAIYKDYDLDDFIENGNDVHVEALNITVVNINTFGNIELSGELTGGMIAIDSNNLQGNIKLLLNGVNINTDSKKVPALYVYNKDITYTEHKVTISTVKDTKNYLEGGKLKKVSLIESDKLVNYQNNYNGDASTWYSDYTNYYGVYSSKEIDNILFAKVTADREDLEAGDPYYYYKASGTISSDIDLYFEGEGYLEVTSKNKGGIETKGNLIFSGGVGDYVIKTLDDCLSTTTSFSENENARNTLTIDVNSLTAIVSQDAEEGDAIDSNGDLIINGGRIIALAKPGQDAGLDSETGTFINGGTIIATGDMYDEIKEASTQNFIALSFNDIIKENNLISLLDNNDNVIFAYQTDRSYTNLVYSSSFLTEGIYSLYNGGVVDGENTNGCYTKINKYTKGEMLGYSNTGISTPGMNDPGGMNPNDGQDMSDGERPKMPSNEKIPELPAGQMLERSNDMQIPDNNERIGNETKATNKEFTISDTANIFSGIGLYVGES